jgi:hypothetical protein
MMQRSAMDRSWSFGGALAERPQPPALPAPGVKGGIRPSGRSTINGCAGFRPLRAAVPQKSL